MHNIEGHEEEEILRNDYHDFLFNGAVDTWI